MIAVGLAAGEMGDVENLLAEAIEPHKPHNMNPVLSEVY